MELVTGRVKQIISMFDQGLDTKDVAKKLGFADHRQMANFMKSKGYIWDADKATYVMDTNAGGVTVNEVLNVTNVRPNLGIKPSDKTSGELLKFLEEHKETIFEIISNHGQVKQLPRYVIPGVYTTKSVYMNHGIDILTREFSEEKNISQRDIFEIALIEFFKKYGYQDQIRILVG